MRGERVGKVLTSLSPFLLHTTPINTIFRSLTNPGAYHLGSKEALLEPTENCSS